MIAFNPFEQMDPERFKLVGANARCNRRANLIQIGLDFGLAEPPHCHPRDIGAFEQYLTIARDSNRGVQLMAAAGKRAQLLRRLRTAVRLSKKPCPERQRLIRADDKVAGPAR